MSTLCNATYEDLLEAGFRMFDTCQDPTCRHTVNRHRVRAAPGMISNDTHVIPSCSHVLVCRSISHVIQFIACINHYVSPYLRNDHRGRRYEFICPSHRYRSITIHACLFLSAVSTHEFTQASHQFRSFPFPIPSSIISPIPPHHFQLTAAPISSIPNSDSGSSRYDLYLTLPPKVNACSSPYHKCLFFST